MGFKSILNRLLAVGLFALAVLRVEYAIAFGRGTSHNQVLVSPLAVTTHFAMVQKEHLPPQVQHFVEKFVVAMAVPGELAIDEGIIPPTKMKKLSKSNKPKTLEIRAREWVAKQKNSKAMAAFVDENTFVISGALICFFSMLLAPMFPNDAFQNHLVGLSLFWFGANGAHGAEVQFSIAFMVMIPLLLFVVFILYDGPTTPSKAAVEKKKAKADAAAEKKKNDDWDDGIGGISMADIRARKEAGGACNDGCCG